MSQEVITKFCWNGAEYEFDARDADDAERFEAALEQMRKDEEALPKEGKASSLIRGQCSIIKRFFDCVLGDGAAIAICGEKDNYHNCVEPYKAFLEMVKAQKDDILSAKNYFAKYSNRSRRAIPAPPNARPGKSGKGGGKK